MKKEKDSGKKQISGFGTLSFLFISMSVAFAFLWFLETQEVDKALKPVSYELKIPKFQPKQKLSQDFSRLDPLEGEGLSFEEKTDFVSSEFEREGKKPLPKKTKELQEALDKESDIELKKAQDLVDSEDEGNILKAKTLLEELLAKNPKHNESIKELAMIYMYDLNDMSKAQEYMEQSYEISPEAPVFNEIMQLASQNKNVESIARIVKEKAEKDPDNPNLASHSAVVLAAQGSHQASAESHARNAQKFRSYKESQYAANQFTKLGNHEEAGRQLRQAYEFLEADMTVSASEKKVRLKLLEQKIKRSINSH